MYHFEFAGFEKTDKFLSRIWNVSNTFGSKRSQNQLIQRLPSSLRLYKQEWNWNCFYGLLLSLPTSNENTQFHSDCLRLIARSKRCSLTQNQFDKHNRLCYFMFKINELGTITQNSIRSESAKKTLEQESLNNKKL